MIPTQAIMTRHGLFAQARIQLASAPVDSRSWAASRPLSVPTPCSVIALPTL